MVLIFTSYECPVLGNVIIPQTLLVLEYIWIMFDSKVLFDGQPAITAGPTKIHGPQSEFP